MATHERDDKGCGGCMNAKVKAAASSLKRRKTCKDREQRETARERRERRRREPGGRRSIGGRPKNTKRNVAVSSDANTAVLLTGSPAV